MTNRKRVMPPRKYQYERRCRGTVFFRNGAMRSSHSKRSSSQLRALRRKLISGLPATAHKNLVAANLHLEAFQGAWRGTRDVSAVQVVHTVVAGTPPFLEGAPILVRSRKGRARGRHRTGLPTGRPEQQSRAVAPAQHTFPRSALL